MHFESRRHLSFSRQDQLKTFLLANRHINSNGCWLWHGAKSGGYGNARVDGLVYKVHRISASVFLGLNIENSDECALHRCDVGLCFNPEHLFIGTNLDNVQDKIGKGRQICGEKIGVSKLTASKVKRIKKLLRSGTPHKRIAKLFHVHHSTIWAIHQNRTWRHVA